MKTKGIAADKAVAWLVTDGKRVYLPENDGLVELIGNTRQRAFTFVVELTSVRSEIRAGIRSTCPEKIAHFKFANDAPVFDPPRAKKRAIRERKK